MLNVVFSSLLQVAIHREVAKVHLAGITGAFGTQLLLLMAPCPVIFRLTAPTCYILDCDVLRAP